MRVIHLLRKLDPAGWGGTETAVQRLATGLRQQGVAPVVYCPQLAQPQASSTCSGAQVGDVKRFRACVPIWGIPAQERSQMLALGGNLMSFDLLPALWREPDVALVHTHTLGRLGGIAATVARFRRLPLVVSIHGGLLDLPAALKTTLHARRRQGWEWGKLFGVLLQSRRLLHRAAAVFTCNPGEAKLLRAQYPRTRIEVQPHAVDTQLHAEDCRAAARKAFPRINNRELLLCVGRIDPVKNQGWLIRHAPPIFQRHPRALLVLAGACADEAYGRGLQQQIRALGLERHVLLTGGLPPGDPRLLGLFQESRAVLLPSISETFGLVLLEAWASGSVVISSRTSGATALVREGENGWVFNLSDPAAFYAAVNDSLTNPELRARLVESGQQLVRREFDVASIARRVKALYLELIGAQHALRNPA